MDSEERRSVPTVAELRERVRAVQKERLDVLEQEYAKQEAFRKATTKISPQQKRILRWMWEETQKQEACIDDYDEAYFFRYTGGGLPWSIGAITGSRPTLSEKASLSRSLGHLIERGLVQRSLVFNDYIVLTSLGRSVCKRLTLC